MKTKSFYVKLFLLIVPIIILASVPFIEGNTNSIGGGGYDLTDLFYGIYILIAIIAWIFFMIIHSLVFRKKSDVVAENSKLIVTGIVVFIIACLILFNTWIK
ncbi:hypothetical protein D3C87_365350 [compost metagenome]|uniref:Uncharacterized protein n=1 Tax=Flavobacterium endophyticum TaxID=1540163 RepID=A0A495M373_9FLAO|nr:hypothetical protein [Flavobacterium endophyticum]RKS20361.1 hypothetical protein CLV94_2740 [Flavobacterium endophyticum]